MVHKIECPRSSLRPHHVIFLRGEFLSSISRFYLKTPASCIPPPDPNFLRNLARLFWSLQIPGGPASNGISFSCLWSRTWLFLMDVRPETLPHELPPYDMCDPSTCFPFFTDTACISSGRGKETPPFFFSFLLTSFLSPSRAQRGVSPFFSFPLTFCF